MAQTFTFLVKRILIFFSILALMGVTCEVEVAACQSCLYAPLHRIGHRPHPHSFAIPPHAIHQHGGSFPMATVAVARRSQPVLSNLGIIVLKTLQEQCSWIVRPLAIVVGIIATRHFISSKIVPRATSAILMTSNDGNKEIGAALDDDMNDAETDVEGKQQETEEIKPVSAVMVGTIGFYKNFISPLLPPACRFLPTCSQYGVQAIEKYGPAKGCVLIAWRLLRCSPIGGKGYDPPKWPPVVFNYEGSFYD